MPFTDVARERMLQHLLTEHANDYVVGISQSENPLLLYVEPIAFRIVDGYAENAEDVVFPRQQHDMEEPATHWIVADEDNTRIATDRLERPILLRKGERATFPAGSLRLELK